jgi:excinuclease ABC subunit A
MRRSISVKNARENNLKNVCVDIPREKLVVFTGLSGSGKSSLAFETIYGEGQRRYLESLSVYARKFVQQLKKPKVDLVSGLSPVISIEQKAISKNPRSTVGTMTDLYDYLRILYASSAQAQCPRCSKSVPVKTAIQMQEHILSLAEGTAVELCAPIFKIYGEDYPFLFGEIRSKGYRRMRIDDELIDISEDVDLDEGRPYALEVVVDKFYVKPAIYKNLLSSIETALRVGEGFIRVRVLDGDRVTEAPKGFYSDFACEDHQITMGEIGAWYYSFNEGDSACATCMGLGIYLTVHPDLLVPDKSRSVRGGAFVEEAFRYDRNTWIGQLMYSLALHMGFSLDTPYAELPADVVNVLLYGSPDRFPLVLPEGANKNEQHVGKLFRFDGIATTIERRYRHYRRQKVAHTWMEEYLRRVMVEKVCPDCHGTRLRSQRLLTTINGKTIHDLCELSIDDLRDFLANLPPFARQQSAGEQVVQELLARIDLLLGIGLDYLSLSRKAATLSGGESQRIRLSVQIGSELMGMLYVLDEPSIGLHPRDNTKMIRTLRRLRDIGNTVIVVEHDEETMRAADFIVEMGPGPGIHGGQVVATGSIDQIIAHPGSLTGQFLSGKRGIAVPHRRRTPDDRRLTIYGARENNLQSVDVSLPIGLLICVTGVSGSGKSTLVHEVLYKKLYSTLHDSRILPGKHASAEGLEHIRDVICIDQSPIGRTPTSNPATYIGVYDSIRQLYAAQEESVRRGYTASRFSFNVKGGRCEECAGQGVVTTSLQFMPDVEVECTTCKGARYNPETLEIKVDGKSISDVLQMSIEEATCFFKQHRLIAHKLGVLNQLGLGYLQLGQSATTISGGEAQRVKLANELSKIKYGGRNLYILDEPTTGLHLADIQRLLDSLNKLVDAGNTVLVIEHHLDIIKTADWIIDLGPNGGKHGGRVVATGTPEQVAANEDSYTGQYLKKVLA